MKGKLGMKKYMLIVVLLVIVTAVAYGWENTVSTTSVIVAPFRGGYIVRDYASRTNAMIMTAGTYVKDGLSLWMAQTAGTTTNTPSGARKATNDAVTWLRVLPGDRNGLMVSNTGTNRVTLNFGETAVAGGGYALDAGETLVLDGDPPQSEVHAISSGGSVTVGVVEY